MRPLTPREKWMLGLCLGLIFVIGNAFAIRSVSKTLRGSDSKIAALKSTLADHEMWLDEIPKAASREAWLDANMPRTQGATLGKLQGDLALALQDDIYNRKLRIDRQSLQDIVRGAFFVEVGVRLEVQGPEATVIDWLTTLQGPDKFHVIKELELELDTRSREIEPQAVCKVTIARWYHPESGEAVAPPLSGPLADPSPSAAPTEPSPGS